MRRILCYGDSNTWGYQAETGGRFPEDVRWTGVLQQLLGREFRVLEEGQPGRTTVWDDPIEEHRNGKTALYSTLECQSPVDLVILMLGTNDLKPRFSLNAFDIAAGVERLVRIIQTHSPDGQDAPPEILLVCPPPVDDRVEEGEIAGMFTREHSAAVSRELPAAFERIALRHGCLFCRAGDWAELTPVDYVHLSARGHRALAQGLADIIQAHFPED